MAYTYPNYISPVGGYMPSAYQSTAPMVNGVQQPLQATQDAFAVRPVTSREEAIATPADFMRPILLPDLGHGTIFLKRFNPNSGASDILEFRQIQPGQEPEYITRQEFEAFVAEMNKKPKARKGVDDEQS